MPGLVGRPVVDQLVDRLVRNCFLTFVTVTKTEGLPKTQTERSMGWTRPEDAKPKAPHKLGLECLGCGAKEASEWRGPGGRYGACCRKKADAATAALKVDAKDAKIRASEARIKHLEEHEEIAIDNEKKIFEELDGQGAMLKEQKAKLTEQSEELAALRQQLSTMAQQHAAAADKMCRMLAQWEEMQRTAARHADELVQNQRDIKFVLERVAVHGHQLKGVDSALQRMRASVQKTPLAKRTAAAAGLSERMGQ